MKTVLASLQSMPAETTESTDPESLHATVKLFSHQRQALAWLTWRETQHPPGGVLADDMGLGKTLTMISLILKQNAIQKRQENCETKVHEIDQISTCSIKSNATLIICPASVLGHWEREVKNRVK